MTPDQYTIQGAINYRLTFETVQKLQPFASVLDVGCGIIGFLSEVEAKNKVGIDINTEAIEYSKKHVKNASFLLTDIHEMPFDDESFDLCFVNNVFHHPGTLDGLSEINRVLQNDGVLVAVVMNKNYPWTSDIKGMLHSLLTRSQFTFSWQSGNYTPFTETKENWFRIFHQAGFQVKECETADSYFLNIFDLALTVIMRISPASLREPLFALAVPGARFLKFVEQKLFCFTRSRSYLFILKKRRAFAS